MVSIMDYKMLQWSWKWVIANAIWKREALASTASPNDNTWAKRKFELLLFLNAENSVVMQNRTNNPLQIANRQQMSCSRENRQKMYFKNVMHLKDKKKSASLEYWFAISFLRVFSWKIVRRIATLTKIVEWCLLY